MQTGLLKRRSRLPHSLVALLFASPVGAWMWRLLSQQPRRWGRVITYHSVTELEVPYFEAQVKMLKESYTVVSLEELVKGVQEGTLEDRCVAVTFDDGFLDNYTNAFPVLQRYGIPATFFVSTQFIDESGNAESEARFCTEQLRVPWCPAMNWGQLKEMKDMGCAVGSHTLGHTRLAGLGAEELTEEVVGSKDRIEGVMGEPCPVFAHPFGRWNDLDGQAVRGVYRAGYEACFAAVRGFNVPGREGFILYRDPVSPAWSASTVRAVVEGCFDFWYRKPRLRLAELSGAMT